MVQRKETFLCFIMLRPLFVIFPTGRWFSSTVPFPMKCTCCLVRGKLGGTFHSPSLLSVHLLVWLGLWFLSAKMPPSLAIASSVNSHLFAVFISFLDERRMISIPPCSVLSVLRQTLQPRLILCSVCSSPFLSVP